MPISDSERILTVLAEQIERSCGLISHMVDDDVEWVDSLDEADALASRMRGIFVATLVGQIEEETGKGFTSIIEELPDLVTAPKSLHWFESMPATSTLQGRAKVMWAIRLAFTHSNSVLKKIKNKDAHHSL